ncbi:MAG: hypothetical protein ABI652_07700 [Acidobacteriota bacterium]
MKRIFLAMMITGAAITGALLAAQNGPGPQGRGGRGPFAGGPPSGSPLPTALDTNRDGVISAAELTSAPASLLTLDANHDGQLAGDELRPVPGRGGRGGEGGDFGGRGDRGGDAPAAGADDLADTLMAFDRDGNGKLERAEVPARFQGLFDRADSNKDDVLTRDELKQSAAAQPQAAPAPERGRGGGRGGFGGQGRGPAGGDAILGALDANGDRRLSASEIAAASTSLKALDVNRDGQLSGDEIGSSFGRRGGRGGRSGVPVNGVRA